MHVVASHVYLGVEGVGVESGGGGEVGCGGGWGRGGARGGGVLGVEVTLARVYDTL